MARAPDFDKFVADLQKTDAQVSKSQRLAREELEHQAKVDSHPKGRSGKNGKRE